MRTTAVIVACRYNLGLLDSRDTELHQYEGAFKQCKAALSEYENTVSDLRLEVDRRKERERELLNQLADQDERHQQHIARLHDALNRQSEERDLAARHLMTELENRIRELEQECYGLRSHLDMVRATVTSEVSSAVHAKQMEQRNTITVLESRLIEAEAANQRAAMERDYANTRVEQKARQIEDLERQLDQIHESNRTRERSTAEQTNQLLLR